MPKPKSSAHNRPKLGQLLQSPEPIASAAATTTTSPSPDYYHRSSATPSASPYNSVTSSPWSQPSPYIKSPWTRLSPFHPTTNHPTLLGSLVREEGHVSSIACSPDFLYTGSDSKTVRVWTKAHHLRDSGGFKSGSGLVKAIVSYSAKGRSRVFTGHQDGKIRVWDSGREHKRVGSMPTWKEYLLGTVNPGKRVQVTRHKRVPGVIMHFDAVSCMALCVEAGLLYSGSWDKTVKVWRLKDCRCLESIAAHGDAVNAVAVGFGGLVFTGSADGTVKVWRRELDGTKPRHVYVQTLLDVQPNAVTSLAVSSGAGEGDDGVLYSGSSDGLVNFWEGKEQLSYGGALRGHKMAVLSLVAAGRRLVLSGSADYTICVWRREPDGAHVCVDVLTGHAGPVKCLAVDQDDVDGDVSDDGEDQRWIVYSGSLDKSVNVWRVFENSNTRAA